MARSPVRHSLWGIAFNPGTVKAYYFKHAVRPEPIQ